MRLSVSCNLRCIGALAHGCASQAPGMDSRRPRWREDSTTLRGASQQAYVQRTSNFRFPNWNRFFEEMHPNSHFVA